MASAKQQPIYLTRTHIKSVRDKKNKTGCGRDIVDGVTLVGTAENDERPSCKMCDEHLNYMRRHRASKSFEKSIEGLNLSTKTANKLWTRYAEGGGDLPRYMQGQAWIPENFKWTHEIDPSFIPLKSMQTSTALVPTKKDVPVQPSTASVSWIGVAGSSANTRLTCRTISP